MSKQPSSPTITTETVAHIAQLAQIPVSQQQQEALRSAFAETLATFDSLQAIDTTDTQPTYQVTGLENVLREDIIDKRHTFTQAQALANAKRAHNGYFVVGRIIEEK